MHIPVASAGMAALRMPRVATEPDSKHGTVYVIAPSPERLLRFRVECFYFYGVLYIR